MSDTLYCSFCGKSQHDVAKLIVGPSHQSICNECVHLCASIVIAEAESGQKLGAFWLSRTEPLDSRAIIKEIVRELRDEARDSGSDRDGGDALAAPCEASQSGGAAASPTPPRNEHNTNAMEDVR